MDFKQRNKDIAQRLRRFLGQDAFATFRELSRGLRRGEATLQHMSCGMKTPLII